MYGVPRASSAVCTTVAALPEIVAGGSGGGRSGGAPFPLAPLPPALLPSPNDTPSVALTPSRASGRGFQRSEEHTSELQSRLHLVCRLLLEKKKKGKTHLTAAAV